MKDLNFKDLLAKYKALPAKTKNLIMVILGIAIFIGAYMLGFQKLQTSTAEIQTQIDEQSIKVSELKGYYDNLKTYENGIDESKKSINASLSTLPFGIKTEDTLMYVKTMNEKVGSNMESISFDADEFIGEFGCVINDQNVTANAMRTGATYNATMTYDQFKNTLNYIYNDTKEVTFVENVSLTYDSAELLLTTTMSLSKYYIDYEGAQYTPVAVPNVPLGNTNPFGTK